MSDAYRTAMMGRARIDQEWESCLASFSEVHPIVIQELLEKLDPRLALRGITPEVAPLVAAMARLTLREMVIRFLERADDEEGRT